MLRFAIGLALLIATATVVNADDKKSSNTKQGVTKSRQFYHGPYRNGYGYGYGHRGHGYGWGGHSSTAAEGYMRGQGARAAGYGQYLRGLGQYQNMRQEALRKHYENEDFRIKKYWETKREWEAEQKRRRDEKHGINAEHKRLDKVVDRAELEARKTAMREAGLLPPKKPQSFVYKGVDYGTYAKFMQSEEYVKFMAAVKWKKAMNAAKERMQDQKEKEAIRFLAERSVMSAGEKMKADERSRAIRRLRLRLGNSWVEKWITGDNRGYEHQEALKAPLPPPLKKWEASHEE